MSELGLLAHFPRRLLSPRRHPLPGINEYPMRVFVTGATGFLGHAVTAALLTRGDQVVALSRGGGAPAPPGAEAVTGDPTKPGPWQERAGACDAVVHLAGEPIGDRRWSDEVKERIRQSRVEGTRQVAAARPHVL